MTIDGQWLLTVTGGGLALCGSLIGGTVGAWLPRARRLRQLAGGLAVGALLLVAMVLLLLATRERGPVTAGATAIAAGYLTGAYRQRLRETGLASQLGRPTPWLRFALLGLGIAEATALAGAASAGQSLLIPVAIAIALANLAAAAGVSGSLRGAPRAPLNVGLRTAAADGMQLVWALLLLVPLATIGQLALALGAGSLLVLATDERLPEALDEGPSPFLSGGTLAGACALAAVLVALGH